MSWKAASVIPVLRTQSFRRRTQTEARAQTPPSVSFSAQPSKTSSWGARWARPWAPSSVKGTSASLISRRCGKGLPVPKGASVTCEQNDRSILSTPRSKSRLDTTSSVTASLQKARPKTRNDFAPTTMQSCSPAVVIWLHSPSVSSCSRSKPGNADDFFFFFPKKPALALSSAPVGGRKALSEMRVQPSSRSVSKKWQCWRTSRTKRLPTCWQRRTSSIRRFGQD
mmetsp:Transcript_45550/g.99495  ORF Transcript_45550/g.99495 Transcript_45550/m.99495 type:complete len:225 (-) Transcript_45550:441-1115(-)